MDNTVTKKCFWYVSYMQVEKYFFILQLFFKKKISILIILYGKFKYLQSSLKTIKTVFESSLYPTFIISN